jgi:hypothetical protein
MRKKLLLITGTIATVGLIGATLVINTRDLSNTMTAPTRPGLSGQKAAQTATSTADKTITYCVLGRGAGTDAELPRLKETLANVYADSRGWSLSGQVAFQYTASGCDFTVWMASPDQMSSFGTICDSYWNCEAENSVVVNMDRWLYMTPRWIASGHGGVSEYRTMLINHETGHMLGFGHSTCPAAGQPAPVMMQESISLDGCTFNIWPLASEQNMLRRMLGL